MKKRFRRVPRTPRLYPLFSDAAAASRPPTIRTKFTPPRPGKTLEITRLYTLMEGERPVTWIAAPAGSGKTVLAAGWLAAKTTCCVWYRIDEGDASLPEFFRQMAGAACSASTQKTIRLPVYTPEHAGSIGLFTKRYFEGLFAILPSSSTIILDNFQLVPDDSAFHEVISKALDMLPERIRVIILSRNSPSPHYVKLRAHEKLQYIGWDDLRLTFEELNAVIKLRGLNLQEGGDLIEHIYKVTEGWAAGVSLYIEHMKNEAQACLELNRPAPEEIFDYFSTELFCKAGREMQQFLAATSLLQTITPWEALELTGIESSDSMLSSMCAHGYFITRLSGAEQVYQYHPLFRDFLRDRASEILSPAELSQLLLKAGALMEKSGAADDAADLYTRARSWSSLTELIMSEAPGLLSQGRSSAILRWIDRVPQNQLESSPWLLYWKGLCILPQEPSSSRILLEKAFSVFSANDDLQGMCAAWARSIEAIVNEWGDFSLLDQKIAWLEDRMNAGIRFPSETVESDMAVCMVYVLVHRRLGHPSIGEWVAKALSLTRKMADHDLRIRALIYASQYYTFIGDRARFMSLLDEMRALERIFTNRPQITIQCAYMEAAACNWACMDSEMQKWAIFRGIACAEANGVHMWDFLFHLLGVYGALNNEDLPLAAMHLEKSALAVGRNPQAICHYNHVAAWYYLVLGDLARALIHAENALKTMREPGACFAEVICHHVMAQVLHRKGSRQEADLHLDHMRCLAEQSGSPWFVYTCQMAEARFAIERGEDERCLNCLRKAFSLGREHRFFSLFWWWEAAVMSRLTWKALESGLEKEYAEELIREMRLVPPASIKSGDCWPWPVKIFTSDDFVIFRDGAEVHFSRDSGQKPVAMLKAIVDSGRSGVTREHLIDLLWPDKDGDKALHSFKFTIHQIRRLIGSDAVLIQGGVVRLNYQICWTDIC